MLLLWDCVHETAIWIKLDKVNENENYIKINLHIKENGYAGIAIKTDKHKDPFYCGGMHAHRQHGDPCTCTAHRILCGTGTDLF